MNVDRKNVYVDYDESFVPKWRKRPDEGHQLTPETIREVFALVVRDASKLRAMHEAESPQGREAMYSAFICGVRAGEQIKDQWYAEYMHQVEELAKGGAS